MDLQVFLQSVWGASQVTCEHSQVTYEGVNSLPPLDLLCANEKKDKIWRGNRPNEKKKTNPNRGQGKATHKVDQIRRKIDLDLSIYC